jgi:hypothetical protein
MSETITQESNHRDAQTPSLRGGWRLWLQWVVATGAGELIGFAVPAIVGPVAALVIVSMGTPFAEITTVGVAVLAGLGEGAVLGFAQWLVLRRYIWNIARGNGCCPLALPQLLVPGLWCGRIAINATDLLSRPY